MNVRANNVIQKPIKEIIKRGIQYRILQYFDEYALIKKLSMLAKPEAFKQYIMLYKQYFSIIKLSDWFQLNRDCKELPFSTCAMTFKTCHHVRLNKQTLTEQLNKKIISCKQVIEETLIDMLKHSVFIKVDSPPETPALVKQNYLGDMSSQPC